MDVIGPIANLVTVVIAALAATIALLQLRRGQQDAKASRNAQLSWSIYQAYVTEDLRQGRLAVDLITHIPPVPTDGREFRQMYRDPGYRGPNAEKIRQNASRTSSHKISAMLRYYQQIGILLEQGLIDADFIFPLIGPSMTRAEPAIRAVVDYYQRFYGGESGHDEAERRDIYKQVVRLIDKLHEWDDARSSNEG